MENTRHNYITLQHLEVVLNSNLPAWKTQKKTTYWIGMARYTFSNAKNIVQSFF